MNNSINSLKKEINLIIFQKKKMYNVIRLIAEANSAKVINSGHASALAKEIPEKKDIRVVQGESKNRGLHTKVMDNENQGAGLSSQNKIWIPEKKIALPIYKVADRLFLDVINKKSGNRQQYGFMQKFYGNEKECDIEIQKFMMQNPVFLRKYYSDMYTLHNTKLINEGLRTGKITKIVEEKNKDPRIINMLESDTENTEKEKEVIKVFHDIKNQKEDALKEIEEIEKELKNNHLFKNWNGDEGNEKYEEDKDDDFNN